MIGSFLALGLLLGPAPLAVFVARSARSGGGDYARGLSLLTTLVVWCTLQASLGMALGALGRLDGPSLVAGELLFFALGGAALRSRAQQGARHDADAPSPAPDALLPWVVALGIGCLAVLAGLAITRPITDYDSLFYHLPTMASWYQHGALLPFDQFRGEQIGTYPYAWELLCSLFFFPFGDDTLVALPNLVAWMVLVVSTGLLGLEIGARSVVAAAFSLAAGSMPLTVEQVNSLHVDLPMAAFFLAGLVHAIRFARSGFVEHLTLVACSAGLLVGIKMSGLTYAGLLAGALLALVLWRRLGDRQGARLVVAGGSMATLALLALASLGLVAGYWYVRNLVELGNPLGLMQLSLGDTVILPGTLRTEDVKRTTLAHLFDPTSRTHLRVLYEALSRELGPFVFVATAACLSLPAVLWRSAGADRSALAATSGLAVLTAILYWTTPYGADTPNGLNGFRITAWIGQGMRYALPLVGLATVVAARCASAWPVPGGVFVALAAASTAALAWEMPVLFAGAFALAALALLAPGIRRLDGPSAGARRFAVSVAVFAVGAAVFLLAPGRDARHESRGRTYGRIVDEIDRLPPDARVGYAMSEKSYLLFGRFLDRTVVFIPLEGASAAEYMQRVRGAGVDVLAVGPLVGGFAQREEAGWFTRPDPPFERPREGDVTREVVLFRITPRGGATRD